MEDLSNHYTDDEMSYQCSNAASLAFAGLVSRCVVMGSPSCDDEQYPCDACWSDVYGEDPDFFEAREANTPEYQLFKEEFFKNDSCLSNDATAALHDVPADKSTAERVKLALKQK